eukprot:gene15614-biopygen12741
MRWLGILLLLWSQARAIAPLLGGGGCPQASGCACRAPSRSKVNALLRSLRGRPKAETNQSDVTKQEPTSVGTSSGSDRASWRHSRKGSLEPLVHFDACGTHRHPPSQVTWDRQIDPNAGHAGYPRRSSSSCGSRWPPPGPGIRDPREPPPEGPGGGCPRGDGPGADPVVDQKI